MPFLPKLLTPPLKQVRKLLRRRAPEKEPPEPAEGPRPASPSRSIDGVPIPRWRRDVERATTTTADSLADEERDHFDIDHEVQTFDLGGIVNAPRTRRPSIDIADHVKRDPELAAQGWTSCSLAALGASPYSQDVADRNMKAERSADSPPSSSPTQSSEAGRPLRGAKHPYSSGELYMNSWATHWGHDR
jgi:hypothetical protein